MLSLENTKYLLKASPDASIVLYPNAPDFTIAWVNQSCCLLTATKLEDLVGKSIYEVLNGISNVEYSKEKAALRDSLAHSLFQKSAYKAGNQYYIKPQSNVGNDQVQCLNCDNYPLLDDQENVLFIVLRMEEVNKEQIEPYPAIELLTDKHFNHPFINHYPDAIFTLSMEGKFLSANKVLLDIAEISFDELVKMYFLPFIADDDLGKVLNNFKRATQGEVLNFDTKIITFKGNAKVLNITPIPIISNQEVIGIYLIAKDITATIQSQQEVKQQREQLLAYHTKMSNILESITDGFYAVERDWTVTYWNKEAERILKMPREAITGKKLWDAYPLDTHSVLHSAYQKAVSDNVSLHMEMHYAPMNTWMEISAFPSEEGLSVYFKDITSRKQTEEKLKEAKQQYQQLFDLNPVPQWVYDLEDYSFKDVNQAAISQYGYSKEEFLSMTVKDIRPREDIELFEELLKANVKEGFYFKGVVRHLKKTGKIINVQVEGNSIIFKGKSARLVIANDITEKLKVEQSLINSEQLFKALVQGGADILAILDKAGNYLYLNQTSVKNLNILPEDFIGKNAFDSVHEEDKEKVISKFKLLAPKSSANIPPYRLKNGYGEFRWIETIITDMTDDPSVNGIVANSRDVTQRIEQELIAEQSIERYNIVSKATSDAIWDYDLLTGVVVYNEAIKNLFGYKEAFSTLAWWQEHVHPDDANRLLKKLQSIIKNKKSRLYVEYRFRCADGSYKNVLDRSFLLYNKEGEIIRMIGSLQDITEREHYVQTVEAQNKLLKEIAWTQSHVVRAPLARIMCIADLLSHGNIYDKSNIELLPHLSRSAAELDTIIREIIRKTEIIKEDGLIFPDGDNDSQK